MLGRWHSPDLAWMADAEAAVVFKRTNVPFHARSAACGHTAQGRYHRVDAAITFEQGLRYGLTLEPKTNGRNTQVFVSYARADTTFAADLHEGIEARGISVFRDTVDTAVGEDWWRRLTDLITSADAVVFVLSKRSAASKVCAREVGLAEKLGKRIIPVVIEDVEWRQVPAGLARLHSIYMTDTSQAVRQQSLDRLAAAITTDLGWVREHTRLLLRAARWQAQGHREHELLGAAALRGVEDWRNRTPAGSPPLAPALAKYIAESTDTARRHRLHTIAAWSSAIAALVVVSAFWIGTLVVNRIQDYEGQLATVYAAGGDLKVRYGGR